MPKVYYLTPSSFCFGVKRSVEELLKIIEQHPDKRIFCIHALVHNPKVTKYFSDRGVQFVESIDDIPQNDVIVVFSAHGITRQILEKAQHRFAKVYNLECPFVSKIYTEADTYLSQWITQFLYIGKADHQEAKNVIDHIRSKWGNVYCILHSQELENFSYQGPFAVLSQTTLNFSNVQSLITTIQASYSKAIIPKVSDVCKATYERQWVITQHLKDFATLVVIWGKESSNTKELYRLGKDSGKQTFYAESLSELLQDPFFISQKEQDVGVTWWASTPVEDILEVIDWYEKKWYSRSHLEFSSSEQ
jgi:4-hydroxy-3-methylbut-2-en-1-yl diphosphate reductase